MIATEHTDAVNSRILAISEDRIQGFVREPFREIARLSGVDEDLVVERIKAMMSAGTIRRVRQTLLATNLAQGALVAWKVPAERLDAAFEYMFRQDPFSGHVVVRSTDAETQGSEYRLWTTVKVPRGFGLEGHTKILLKAIGAEKVKIMPAKGIFTLGVGHVRRRSLEPGARSDRPARMIRTEIVELNDLEWKVLTALKKEFAIDEVRSNPWERRASEAGLKPETFFSVAEGLQSRKIIGRFSTFLEHVKPSAGGIRVTRFNGLFHWAVPQGMEEQAGSEVGRHEILTHCYWREAGSEFGGVNIMAVAHGTDKQRLLDHKAAMDSHLADCGIPVFYTNVFWGGRSEIKPSEISPIAYREWLRLFDGNRSG
jgi:DNA-binding Lrp family transcriptional regulator